MQELNLSDPAKIKAATTYNSAAEHFDDAPLAFWDRYGRRTVARLGLERCIGYLGHPFKNNPFETEKDQLSLLANTAG
jgi:hypothetical protein